VTAVRPGIQPVLATNFRAGAHEVRLWMLEGRWYVAVNGIQLTVWHKTQADAWTAGVTEADRLDRPVT
jgi:hypothetical protein